jgi:hypothetical protein
VDAVRRNGVERRYFSQFLDIAPSFTIRDHTGRLKTVMMFDDVRSIIELEVSQIRIRSKDLPPRP